MIMVSLKKDEYVTKSMLQEAVDAILHGVDILINNLGNGLKKEMDLRFKKVDRQFEEIKTETSFIKQDIRDLRIDTPSLKEFNTLKETVDTHLSNHPN
jgi:hypothetical protein